MDDPAAAEITSPASTIGEFSWPVEIEVGTDDWQRTKTFPFPHLQLTAPPNPDDLSTEECRLLFHICVRIFEVHVSSFDLSFESRNVL